MRRFLLLLLLAPVLAVAAPLEEQLAEATALFQKANELALSDPAAARDLYRQATLRFGHLTGAEGIENPRLLMNEGNAALLAGDLGRAVFAFRRAGRLPGVPDSVAGELEHVRAQILDTFEDLPDSPLQRIWAALCGLPRGLWGAVFALAWALAWWWGFRALRANPQERLAWLGRSGAALLLGVLALLALRSQTSRAEQPFGVLVADTVARKGDGLIYDPAFSSPLHPGLEFEPLQQRRGWIEARFADGTVAWLEEGGAMVWP